MKVPAGWRVLPFGQVVENSQYGISTPSTPDGTIPILGMKNIDGGKVVVKHVDRVRISKVDLEKQRLQDSDLLFNRTNSLDLVGKTGLFKEAGDYVCASYLVRFRLRKELVDPRYICYLFNTSYSQRILLQLATKAVAQVNINPTILQRAFLLPLPPRPEQAAIADFLEVWDDCINKKENFLAKSREFKRGLMQQLLTGQMRFKEFKGEKWQSFKLEELFAERVETGRTNLPLVAITGQNGVVPRDSLTKRDNSSEDKSKYLRITPGDIGYNTMRMWQGVAGLSKIEGIVSPAYTICIPTKKIDGQFAAYLFKTAPMIHAFHRNSQGLVDDTLSLKYHNFSRIHVKIPDVPEQKRIAAVLVTCDAEIKLLEKQLERLKQQKRGLMQKLLTGEVRVKVAKEGK